MQAPRDVQGDVLAAVVPPQVAGEVVGQSGAQVAALQSNEERGIGRPYIRSCMRLPASSRRQIGDATPIVPVQMAR